MVLLEFINYQRLLDEERNEIEKLVNVCRTKGIFYLDMTVSDPFTDLQKTYDASVRYFGQTPEAKQADFVQGVERGYSNSAILAS